MRNLTLVAAAVAVLFTASPVLAQDAASAATAAAPVVPTEAEISAAGEAFGADMEDMQAELQAARTAAGADTARANADADAIQATYQAKADAFAASLQAFVTANPGMIPPEDLSMVLTQIQRAPAMVRQGVMSAPAGAATAAPAS